MIWKERNLGMEGLFWAVSLLIWLMCVSSLDSHVKEIHLKQHLQ